MIFGFSNLDIQCGTLNTCVGFYEVVSSNSCVPTAYINNSYIIFFIVYVSIFLCNKVLFRDFQIIMEYTAPQDQLKGQIVFGEK